MSKIEKGSKLPVFTLNNQIGEPIDSHSFIGKKNLVIFFYPKDDSPGCTKEACSFRDAHEEFLSLDCEVIGISSDSEESHKKFAAKHHLPYTLLADIGQKVRKIFGVPTNLFGLVPGRVTYVFDKKGICLYTYNSQTQFNKHIIEAKKILSNQK